MYAKKLSSSPYEKSSYSKNKGLPQNTDHTLHIEWGDIQRSEFVEYHISEVANKIIQRSKEATHLVVHLSIDVTAEHRSKDLIRVGFELRFPKHQDLFCESKGENLYEIIAQCKSQMLKMINRRKRTRLKVRNRSLRRDHLLSL